jgi:uncharacterized protein with FMN-binding domain
VRRHLAAWALVLAACAGAVASRVLGGDQQPPETFALSRSHAEPHVRTVTRTRTVVVTTRTVEHAAPRRTPAPARRVAAPAPATTPRARRAPDKPVRAHRRKHATGTTQPVEGDAIPTRYGAVQVQLTLRGRRIVDVVVLKDPDDLQRSREIDADALPKLRAQLLAAQSAQIDGVAGATYTSQGYRQSVQSALDLA